MSFGDIAREDARDISSGNAKALLERYPNDQDLLMVLGNPFSYWENCDFPEAILALYLSRFPTGSDLDHSLFFQAASHQKYVVGLKLLLTCSAPAYVRSLEFMGENWYDVCLKTCHDKNTACVHVLVLYLDRSRSWPPF